jgi:hypothetical protein
LAHDFAAHQFDVKYIIRAITATRAYQLSSRASDSSQDDPRLFARMAVKGLSAEQLYDSLAVATGYQDRFDARRAGLPNSPRDEFLARFSSPSDRRTEHQTSILQALTLMNGRLMSELTGPGEPKEAGKTLTLLAVLDAPFLDTTLKQVEALYLAALSRKPNGEELARITAYVERGGPSGNHRQALADVFWALLNSSEFILNH